MISLGWIRDLHGAEPEHARDGELATSRQAELPDLQFGQSPALTFQSYSAILQGSAEESSTHP